VTDWVIQNILAGALRPDGWIELVDGLGAPLGDELSDRVSSNDLTEMRVPGVIPLLRRFADRESYDGCSVVSARWPRSLPPANPATTNRRSETREAIAGTASRDGTRDCHRHYSA
jgi:hypothetical protein